MKNERRLTRQIKLSLYGPDQADHIDQAVREFSVQPPADAGLDVADTEALMEEAESCLAEFEIPAEPVCFRSHCAVKKLGREPREKGKDGGEKDLLHSACSMARVLRSYGEELSLHVVSRMAGKSGRETEFILSSELEDPEPLEAMIRSVYRKAEVRPAPEPPEYSIRLYASGCMAMNGKKEDRDREEKAPREGESWISAVAASLPESGNYTVTVRMTPLTDRAPLRAHLEALDRCSNRMRFYSDLNWGNSLNLGHSIAQGQNAVSSIVGVNTSNHNAGYSINLSGRDVHKRLQMLSEQLEKQLERFTRENGGVWGASLRVTADSMDTIQALTSILTGNLSEAGCILSWGMDPDRKPIVLCGDEALPFFRFPTGEFNGCSFADNEHFALNGPAASEEDPVLGNILWNRTSMGPFRLAPKFLSRHAFVCGMTGAGKTNTMFEILQEMDLPFLVIEPVKGEYRALAGCYSDFSVYTMKSGNGADSVAQTMRINPFWFPEGGNLAFHIDSLKVIISSAFELSAAMPNILEQCLYNIYIKAGWDLVTNRNTYQGRLPEDYLYPTFSDLCSEIESYLNRSEFGSDLMGDYKGALLSRMRSFVNGYKGILLNTSLHPDYQAIMDGHTVIELEGLADDGDKSLVMGTILTQYYQYLKLHFRAADGSQSLRHLFIIEEAHRLFKKPRKRTEGSADPNGQLVDALSNMMAEIRAFGEGMLVVDQSPTKVADDVIKNSATKIIHRIDNSEDIKAVRSSLLLPNDMNAFAMLEQGEALIRTDGMERPCKVKVFCSEQKERYRLSDSFREHRGEEDPLSDLFTATSVLSDDRLRTQVEEKVLILLNTLYLKGFGDHYSLCADLMVDIIELLNRTGRMDEVQYRSRTIFEMVSLSVKHLMADERKPFMGAVHLMVMRLLRVFWDRREGYAVKPGTEQLFLEYFDRNIRQSFEAFCLRKASFRDYRAICRGAGLEEGDPLSHLLMSYLCEILPAIRYDREVPEAWVLQGGFLLDTISPMYRKEVQEALGDVFTGVRSALLELIDKEE